MRPLGGLHRFTGWDAADPHRLGRLPGDVPRRAPGSSRRTGSLPKPPGRVRAHPLTPERAVDLQLGDFGVDVAMALDECTPWPATRDEARVSMELTHRWAARAAARRDGRWDDPRGALFGIVQGGMCPDLRRRERRAHGGRSRSTGSPAAGCPWESRRTRCGRWSRPPAPLLPPDKPPATSWASGGPTISSTRSRTDSTSSTVSSRRGRRGTAFSTRPRGRS